MFWMILEGFGNTFDDFGWFWLVFDAVVMRFWMILEGVGFVLIRCWMILEGFGNVLVMFWMILKDFDEVFGKVFNDFGMFWSCFGWFRMILRGFGKVSKDFGMF